MPMVWLGNPAPMHAPKGVPMPLEIPEGKDGLITTMWIPDTYTKAEQIHNIAHPAEGQWNAHSFSRRPAWVASDDPELEQALAEEFGCPAGRPE